MRARWAIALLFSVPTAAAQNTSLTAIERSKTDGYGILTDKFGWGLRVDGDNLAVLHSFVSSTVSFQEHRRAGASWQFLSDLPAAAKFWTFSYASSLALTGHPSTGNVPPRANVLRKNGAVWSSTWLNAPDGFSAGTFGFATAIDGTTVILTNPERSDAHTAEGAIYVYENTGSALVLQQILHGGAPNARLGMRVAIDGDQMLAMFAEQGGWTLRAFERSNGQWSVSQPSLGVSTGVNWGYVEMDRGLAVMGRSAGGAHVFANAGDGWFLDHTITNVPPSSASGNTLAVLDGVVALGVSADDQGGAFAGAVYLYARNDGWRLQTVVRSSDLAADDNFGNGVALTGPRLLVGAPGQDGFDTNRGALYTFRLDHDPARVHCVPERTAAGCVSRMGFSGVPSVTSTQPFTLSASSVPNRRPGSLVFTLAGPQFLPYPGGIRCLAAPRELVARQLSVGSTTGTDCSGSLSIDFNALIQSGSAPQLMAGVTVNAQWTFRDPDGPSALASTEAVEFTIQN